MAEGENKKLKSKRPKALLFDFSRLFLFPKDQNYSGDLNPLYESVKATSNPFRFWDHFSPNTELVETLREIKKKTGVPIYVFTTGHVQNDPEVQKLTEGVFDRILVATDMGMSKKDVDTYKKIATDLGLMPGDIIFTDDSLGNIVAAQQAGLRTFTYPHGNQPNNGNLIEYLKDVFGNVKV